MSSQYWINSALFQNVYIYYGPHIIIIKYDKIYVYRSGTNVTVYDVKEFPNKFVQLSDDGKFVVEVKRYLLNVCYMFLRLTHRLPDPLV